jgi:hypothetical protein
VVAAAVRARHDVVRDERVSAQVAAAGVREHQPSCFPVRPCAALIPPQLAPLIGC